MNKKIALSIEQMKHLEELGLDTSDASMYWSNDSSFPHTSRSSTLLWACRKKNYDGNVYSAYTLQDVLNKLPKTIPSINNTEYVLEFCTNELGYEGLSYYLWDYPTKKRHECVKYGGNGTILDCAFNLLVWCIENGYIKTNKN